MLGQLVGLPKGKFSWLEKPYRSSIWVPKNSKCEETWGKGTGREFFRGDKVGVEGKLSR